MNDSNKSPSSAGSVAGFRRVKGRIEGGVEGDPDAGAEDAPAGLILFGTDACHLCDEARRLVAPLAQAFGWTLGEVDVADDDALFARYGTRVPVLLRSDLGIELDWPFDARALRDCVAAPRAAATREAPFGADG